jgi:hypothetical protein
MYKDPMLGKVAQTCNPSSLGGRDQKIAGRGQPKQKVCKNPCQAMSGYSGECLLSQLHEEAQLVVQTSPSIKQEPISKIINTKKRAGRTAQMFEPLSTKHKFKPR